MKSFDRSAFMFAIASFICLLSPTAPQSPSSLDPIILLSGQSSRIPLLPFISSSNTSFTLSEDSPSYVTLTDFLISNFSVNITGAPSNLAAAAVSDSSVAFVDNSFNFYYGSYGQDSSTIALNTTPIPAYPGSKCTSVNFCYNEFAIICEMIAEQQTHTIYLWEPGIQFASYSQDIPYSGSQTPLMIPKVLSYGGNIVSYFNDNSTKGISPTICTFPGTESAYLACFTFSLNSIETVQSAAQSNLIFANNGQVFTLGYGGFVFSPYSMNLIGNLSDSIVQSCSANQNYDSSIVAFSNTTLYYFLNSTLVGSYSIPQAFSPISCVIDSTTDFLFLLAQENQDLSTHILLYLLTGSSIKTNLADVPLPAATGEVLSISQGQSSGQIVLLFTDNILILTFSKPSLVLQNVQESGTFSIIDQNSQEIIPVNVTVLPSISEIYPRSNTTTQMVSFEPVVNLQDYLWGPTLGVLSENNSFFGGVYGPCTVSNYGDLNLSPYPIYYVKSSAPSDLTTYNNNSLYATIVYVLQANVTYIEVAFDNPYFGSQWNPNNECNIDIQILNNYSTSVLSNSKFYFGPNNDYCIAGPAVYEITKNGLIQSNVVCPNDSIVNLLVGTYFDVLVCIDIYFWSIFGGFLQEDCIGKQPIGQTFAPYLVTMFQQSPSTALFVFSYSDNQGGLFGIMFTQGQNPDYQVVFQIPVNYSENSYIQLTQDRLILADLFANVIMEWDISDLNNPFFIGNYWLYNFKLDLTVKPAYHPIPNHLILPAVDGEVPYLLVFQPGNTAPSTLLYAINLQDVLQLEEFVGVADYNLIISSIYNSINQYTMFFTLNTSNLTLFWATSSPFVHLNETTQIESDCLYCSGTTTLNVTSSLLQTLTADPPNFNISLSYVVISSEQTITSQTLPSLGYDITYEEPLYILPSKYFQGTLLDYNVSELTASIGGVESEVISIKTPISLSQSLQFNFSVNNYENLDVPLSLSFAGTIFYGSSANTLWTMDIQSFPFQVSDLGVVDLGGNSLNFVAGPSDSSQDLIIFAFSQIVVGQYSNNTSWGIFNYDGYGSYTIPKSITKIVNLKVLGSYVFVLVQSGFDLIYVINATNYDLSCCGPFNYIATVETGLSPFTPVDFSVENLYEDLYAFLIVDGNDTIRSIVFNITSGNVQFQLIDNFTPYVQSDLPQETLQIMATQSVAKTPQNQLWIIEYVLYVANFHSYQVQIVYGQDITIGNITNCFVQMPDHTSTGYATTTDSYYLDIKRIDGFYYLYSYPFNLTYSPDAGQNGQYPYVKPIQRQLLGSPQNMAIYAMNGENGLAIVATYTPDPTTTQNVQIQVYTLRSNLQIAFNPSIDVSSTSNYNLNQIGLTVGNDNYNTTTQFTLHSRKFTRSGYFIGLMCIVGVAFSVLCHWIIMKIVRSKKVKLSVRKEEGKKIEMF